MKNIIASLFIALSVITNAQTPDASFGNNGVAFINYTDTFYNNINLCSVGIQSNGKIITGGYAQSGWVGRHNQNGELDTSFGVGGWTTVLQIFPLSKSANIFSLAIQTDDKIVVCGRGRDTIENITKMFVARLTPDGTADTTFGQKGIVYSRVIDNQNYATANCVAIQNDGKIILGGNTAYSGHYIHAILRYTTDGVLDTTFDSDGRQTFAAGSTIRKIILQTDGKIVCLGVNDLGTNGYTGQLVRYNNNGSLDTTFNSSGMLNTSFGTYEDVCDAIIQTDGKIVFCGGTENIYYLARINSNGTLDTSFGSNGIKKEQQEDASYCLFIRQLPDGKILSHGWKVVVNNQVFKYISLYMLHNPDGQLKTNFGNNGNFEIDITEGFSDNPIGLIMPDSISFISAGQSDNEDTLNVPARDYYLAKYILTLNTGTLEFTLTETAPLLYPNPIQQVETLKYTLAENETISISLIDATGKLVQTFIENENQTMGDHEQVLNFPTNLAKGSYYLVISSPKGKTSIKLMN